MTKKADQQENAANGAASTTGAATARPRGLAARSTPIQTMAKIEALMDTLDPKGRDTVVEWFTRTYDEAPAQ